MKIKVNGKEYEFEEGLNVNELLDRLKIKKDWIVVEHNVKIITREQHEETILKDNDSVEIVGFVGGG